MPEHKADTREFVVLLLAMIFPSTMAWLEFWVLPGEGTHNPALQMVFGLGKLVQFALPLVFVLVCDRGSLVWRKPSSQGMGVAVAFGLLVSAGAFILYYGLLRNTWLFQDTATKVNAWLHEFGLDHFWGYWAMAGFMSVLHSFLEEYYWRWFVFGRLRKYTPLGWAIGVSSVAFMAHHVLVLGAYFPERFWAGAAPFSLCVAVGGVVWAWLYHRHQSLYGPWISHLMIDAAIMVVGYDMVSDLWH